MKLVLLCTAGLVVLSAVQLARPASRESDCMEQIYREANLTPVPKKELEVYFDGYEVPLGMEISPVKVQSMPCIKFDSKPGSYYTVMVLAPDCPSPDDPYLGPFIMGLYVNAKSNSDGVLVLEDGCEISRWIGLNSPPLTGRNRYFIHVYRQLEMINTTDEALLRLQYMRFRFSVSAFVKTYKLVSPPDAGTMWYSRYPLKDEDDQDAGVKRQY